MISPDNMTLTNHIVALASARLAANTVLISRIHLNASSSVSLITSNSASVLLIWAYSGGLTRLPVLSSKALSSL